MIHQLKREGLTVRAIARRTGLDHKTVRKYLALGLDAPVYGPRAEPSRAIDDYRDYLRQRLTAYGELTAVRLHREITALGFEGSYDTVKRAVARIRPPKQSGFEHRFETPPGQQAQVDFAHFQVRFTAEPGQVRSVWLFSMVLGNSRFMFCRFVLRQDMPAVVRCHAEAFAAYRAKTKGKVERPFRYIRQDFFLGREFRDLEDLNAQLAEWLATIAILRVHGTTRRIVHEACLEERPSLQPLPALPLRTVLRLERRVTRDGMVSVDGNEYSVPDSTRRRLVEIQVTVDDVRILEAGTLIAVHPVLTGRGQRRIAAGHRQHPAPGNARRPRADDHRMTIERAGDVVVRRELDVYDQVAGLLAQSERGATCR